MVQINTSGEENKNGLGKNKFARCIYEVLTYPYIPNNTNLLIMIFLDEKEGISCAKYIKEQCHNLKLLGMFYSFLQCICGVNSNALLCNFQKE